MHKAISLVIKFYFNINKCNRNEHTLSKTMRLSFTPDRNLFLLSFEMQWQKVHLRKIKKYIHIIT